MKIVGTFRQGKQTRGELAERDRLPLVLQGGVLAEWILSQVTRRRGVISPKVELVVSHSDDKIARESAGEFTDGFVDRIGKRGGLEVKSSMEKSRDGREWVNTSRRQEQDGRKITVFMRMGNSNELKAVAKAFRLGKQAPDATGLFSKSVPDGTTVHKMTSDKFHGSHIIDA